MTIPVRHYFILSFVSMALFATSAEASETSNTTQPAWLKPQVLEAALRIELTAEQRPRFREALTNMVTGRQKTTRKLLRQNNQTHLERKLRTATNRQLKKMDAQMKAFLRPEQLPGYYKYRELLKAHMTDSTLADSSSSTKHTDGIGTHNPDWH